MPVSFPEHDEKFLKTKEIDEALDEFENQMAGIAKWQKMDEPVYLRMPLEELRKKSPSELSEAILDINRYALNVQRLINRLRSFERWGNRKLDEYAAENFDKLGNAYGHQERLIRAKNQSEPCKKLNAFLREIDMKITRLYGLPENLRAIADSIRDIKFAAIRQEKEYNNE